MPRLPGHLLHAAALLQGSPHLRTPQRVPATHQAPGHLPQCQLRIAPEASEYDTNKAEKLQSQSFRYFNRENQVRLRKLIFNRF